MRKILLLLIVLSTLLSCRNTTDLENQIIADLVGMLHNKAEVKELLIKQVSKINNQTQIVHFNCTLYFINDLYKDDGTLAFKRGLTITEKNNTFYYSHSSDKYVLVKVEFGETTTVKQ